MCELYTYTCMCVCIHIKLVLVAESCPTLCDAVDRSPTRLLCPWESPRQEHWSGLPFPSPGDLPDPGSEPRSPVLQADSLPVSHLGSTYASQS